MNVFVKWDPIHKRVVCIHTTRYGNCPECLKFQEDLKEIGCFLIEEGMEFRVQES